MKLAEVRRFALGLPEVTEEPHHEFSSFRVRGKIFVTVPPTEDRIHIFASELERKQALGMYPAWAERLLWGGKVVGIKVHLAAAAPAATRHLVQAAWQFKAPAALAQPALAGMPKATAVRRNAARKGAT